MEKNEKGFVYAVVFDNAVVKIGMSSSYFGASNRISSHRNYARAFDHEVIHIEVVEVNEFGMYSIEKQMLDACIHVAERKSKMESGEWFRFRSNDLAIEFISAAVPFIEEGKAFTALDICGDSPSLAAEMAYFSNPNNFVTNEPEEDNNPVKPILAALLVDDRKSNGKKPSPQVLAAIKLMEMNPSMTRYEAAKHAGITPGALYNSRACQALMKKRKC